MRKRRKLSQQQLADELGVKRSNIAAYETKNVEPRLSLIGTMADYFQVRLQDLVVRDIKSAAINGEHYHLTGGAAAEPVLSHSALSEIKDLSVKIQRMLDGFKVFYEFKRKSIDEGDISAQGDIDNFLVFINHMLEYNRLIENSLRLDSSSQAVSRSKEAGAGASLRQADENVAAE